MKQNTKRILIFIAFSFGVPWLAALVISFSGLLSKDAVQAVSLANIFFIATPWLATVLTRLVTREGWGNLMLKPNIKRGWRFYLAVWFLPLLLTTMGAAVFYLLFPQSFDANFGPLQKLTAGTPSSSISPWILLVSMTVQMMLISVPINMVVSMGEEFGWRAYLLPKLVDHLDGTNAARNAALLTGVIHGLWHWPLMLLALSITPGETFLTPLVYVVFTCALSVLLSWATLRSGSAWTAALGHGSVNATSALPGFMLNGQPFAPFGPDPTGLIGGFAYILLALFLSRSAFGGKKEAASELVIPRTDPV